MVDFRICSVEPWSSTRKLISFMDSLDCPLSTGRVSVRDILWCLVFTGFAVNYMFRLNVNIGIVSMVKSRPPKMGNTSQSSACIHSQTALTSDNSSTNSTTIALHLPDEVSLSLYYT